MRPRHMDKLSPMNALADVETAHRMLSRLETIEAARQNTSVSDVRLPIARRLKASPGTLENIRRLRLKAIPSWLMGAIRSDLIAILQIQIRGLENETNAYRQTNSGDRDDVLVAVEAQIATAKAILDGAK